MRRVVLALLVALPAGEAAAGDPAAGERVFARCRVCHIADEPKNRPTGPHLHGALGRTAGSVEGFRSSDAMRGSGIVRDETTLHAYLADPRGFIPGNRMAFAGLKKAEARANVIACLKSVAPE
jgi:cytochrome c